MGKGFGLGKQDKSKQYFKAYLNLVDKIFDAVTDLKYQQQRINRVLKANSNTLDEGFVKFWGSFIQRHLSNELEYKVGNTAIGCAAISALIHNCPVKRASCLEVAIAGYEVCLPLIPREHCPEEWANCQSNLGNAYNERIKGDPADNIEQAIYCYTEALTEYTRSRFPTQWADNQYKLGAAYFYHRIRGERAENIEQAIEYFTAASQEYTRSRFPTQWARTKYDLGSAYLQRIQGEQSDNIEQAIQFFLEALEECQDRHLSGLWTRIQNNLGLAYMKRIQGEQAENIEQAIHCYTSALQDDTRSRFPELWVILQSNLGDAYHNCNTGNRGENVERSIRCYQAVLQEWTRDRFPEKWAQTQHHLANAYLHRIQGDIAENIEQAIQCFTAALQVRTRDRFPQEWAKTKIFLGYAYRDRIQGDQAENLELSIENCTEALQECTREQFPEEWAETLLYLGMAYCDRIEGNKAENIEQAISCFTEALKEYTRDRFPRKWASTQMELGIAYTIRSQDDKAENIKLAIHCFTEALKEYTYESLPLEWADVQHNLGCAYVQAYFNSSGEEQSQNLEAAICCFTEQLQIYTPNDFPQQSFQAGFGLGHIAFAAQMWEQAIFGYTAAIDAVEQSRTWATSETRRQEIVEQAIGAYQNIVQAYVHVGQLDKAIEYVERSRSKRLVDLIASKDFYQDGKIPQAVQEFLQKYERLQQQSDDLLEGQTEQLEITSQTLTENLQKYPREQFPEQWAQTQLDLGDAYLKIVPTKADNIEQAIFCYTEALKEYTRDRFPKEWVICQNNLSNAYLCRMRGEKADNIEQFIYHVKQVLEELSQDCFLQEKFPLVGGTFQANLGNIYSQRIRGEKAENLELAIYHNTEALKKLTRDRFPEIWVQIQYNLANAWQERIRGKRADNQEQAIGLYKEILQECSPWHFPKEWAMTQGNLGKTYLNRIQGERADNLELAIHCTTAALQVYTRDRFPEEWSRCQYNLGIAYSQRIQGEQADNLEQTINYFTQALQGYTREQFPQQWAETQYHLGVTYLKGNHREQAIKCLKAALQEMTRDRFPLLWATAQCELGVAYLSKVSDNLYVNHIRWDKDNNIEEGIECFTAALQELTQERFPKDWVQIQMQLGSAYVQRVKGERADNLELAIQYLTRALTQSSQDNHSELLGTIYNDLGNAYLYRLRGERADNLEQAIYCFKAAVREYIRCKQDPRMQVLFLPRWAMAHNNLGNTYRQRIRGEREDNLEQSLNSYTEVLRECSQKDFPTIWASTQLNLGNIYLQRRRGTPAENQEQAIACFTKALQEYTRDRFPTQWADIHHSLGTIYCQRLSGQQAENIQQGIDYYTEALQEFTRSRFPKNWATTQSGLAEAYVRLAKTQWGLGDAYVLRHQGEIVTNVTQAIGFYQKALQEFTASTFPEECLTIGKKLGETAYLLQMWEQAILGYAAAIDAVEQNRTWATSEARRQEIVAESIDIYTKMVEACVNAGQFDKALEYVERSRSKRLVDLMASNDLYQGGEIPQAVQELLQQYESLQQQIDHLRFQNNSNSNRNVEMFHETSLQHRAALRADNEIIATLETQKQQVWENLRKLDPVVAGEIQVSAPNLAAIQKLIDQPTTAILSFYSTKKDTHIFVLRQNRITHYISTGQGQETLQAWIQDNWLSPYLPHEGETKEEKAERKKVWYSRMSQILAELAEKLKISDLVYRHLEGIEELIIVPHLLLHQIPFAALPIGDNQYLGDKFLIRYTPSCQILEFCHQRGNVETFQPTSLQYGTVEDAEDNLPCASFEGEKIADLYNIPQERRLIGSSQATRNNYRQLIQKVQVLHSCHHAEFRLDNPLESQLKLADGSITLGQLMTPGWRFPNLLDVFLSCCETNLGNPSITDDILTLSTGFLCAGARSVVSTLWSVNDLATALFSIFYYQYRQQDCSRPEALRQAKTKLCTLKKEELKKEELKEMSKQAEIKRKEARKKRNQYQLGSVEYLECDREYRKYAGVTIEIDNIKNSQEEFPFSHPQFWAAFTCQGLR